MDDWKDFRNYEVSVWTLQDNYITTLKSGDPIQIANPSKPAIAWSQARAHGQIQNGKMTLNIDGTQNLSFDIPMYLYVNGERKENPNWYNVVNKNVLVSMRKIKVIFNKWQNIGDIDAMSNSTFEFIILKVQESHEEDNLICHVECEGLAFHELGKVGYKISLSTKEFNDDYEKWQLSEVGADKTYSTQALKDYNEPKATMDYWMGKANIPMVPVELHNVIKVQELNPNKWYYSVRMVHSSLDHDEDTSEYAWDNQFVNASKIYDLSYASDWNSDGVPVSYVEAKEMCRLVDIEESNLYNITQDLAEKFGVFCRYQYYYDNNYNIIGRVIVFYNNFLQERQNVTTLMYPNSASKISREMDSTDVSTKMFVRNVEVDDLYEGVISIMDSKANKTREDYLLNFDYLHDIGTISDEQYAAISDFEVAVRKLNDQIVPTQEILKNLETLKTDVDAKITILDNSISLDEERITENAALLNALDAADGEQDGYITIDFRNPDTLPIVKDSSNAKYDTYYVQFNQDKRYGVKADTVHLYKKYNSTSTSTFDYGLGFQKFSKPNSSNNAYDISVPNSSDCEFIYKGTIGENPGVTELPSSPSNGDSYKAITENYPSIYKINVGQWLCYNGTKKIWEVSDSVGTTNKGTIGQKPDISSLSESTDAKKGWVYRVIHSGIYGGNSCTYGDLIYFNGTGWTYLAKPNNVKAKDGFFVFKCETVTQKNGLQQRIYTCTRKCAEGSSLDYITKIRTVFFTTTSNTVPDTPKIETAKTDATDIKTYNVLDNWSTFISLPEDTGTAFNLYRSVEISHSQEKKEYLSVSGPLAKDGIGTNITNALTAQESAALQDEIKGLFEYDEYGNLDKVTGLFKTIKNGNYVTYGHRAALANNLDAINTFYNNPNASDTTYPSDQTNTYIIVQNKYFHSNGNITYSYTLKYVDENGLPAAPTTKTNVYQIVPIFYLKEKSNTVPAPTKDNVKDVKTIDTWTTLLPDKINTNQYYYMGYKVTNYNNKVSYYYNEAPNETLKKAKQLSTTEQNEDVQSYLYATYKYRPDLYYEQIKKSWEQKLYQDKTDLADYQARKIKLNDLIDKVKIKLYGDNDEIIGLINEKKDLIAKFEYMMGAALRESYWQPEDEYQDYGEKHKDTLALNTINLANDSDATYWQNNKDNFSYIGWDSSIYDEEDKLYYESSVLEEKVYYPCIDLSKVNKTMKNKSKSFLSYYADWCSGNKEEGPYSFFFHPSSNMIPDGDNIQDIRYCKYYVIGSGAKLLFAQNGTEVIPVLVLTDTSSLSNTEIANLKASGCIGQLQDDEVRNGNDVSYILRYNKSNTYSINSNSAWIENPENLKVVYPRIIVPSLKLKTNDRDLALKLLINGAEEELKKYEDYYILTKTYYDNTQEGDTVYKFNSLDNYLELDNITDATKFISVYNITIKPEALFRYPVTTFNFNCYFALSNADVDILLDAQKILKENAYPKVSYEIEVNLWSRNLLKELYTKLAQLVMINDTDLKLQNTFGYISQIELDLDHEENDSVEVKNYKTKFEDLFSKIVAETEEMHKNSFNIGQAGAMVSGGGVDATITPDGFNKTLSNQTTQDILKSFLDEYFDSAAVVQKTLKSMWDDAGAIFADASKSLGAVMSLTSKNAGILAGFRENVAEALTPSIYHGENPPTNFKPGDVWENNGVIAVATGYSGDGQGGFTQTYNGKLAEISGSSFGMNAETGEIDIINETNINLMSGKDLYIAANDNVNIVGNKAVNIGGTAINMASANIIGDGYPDELGAGGIHLVSTEYNYSDGSLAEGSTSTVDIDGSGIQLASKNGIIIKSGSGIDIKASDETNVSAVQIDKDKGVWIGSNKTVSLFSGNVDGESKSGANVELSADHLLLGVGDLSSNSATAIEMTKEQIILAAGSNINAIQALDTGVITDSSDTNISGVQIRDDYIGMATGNANNRSLLSIRPTKVLLGQANLADSKYNIVAQVPVVADRDTTKEYLVEQADGSYIRYYYSSGWKNTICGAEIFTGSYLWLSQSEVYIGSMGNFTLNTNNIKIQSKLLEQKAGSGTCTSGQPVSMGFALGRYLQGKDGNNDATPDVGLGFWITEDSNHNPVKHLVVDGDITAETFIANGNNGKFIANENQLGFYDTNNTAILTMSSTGLTCSGTFTISSSNLILGNNQTLSSALEDLSHNSYQEIVYLYTQHSSYTSAPATNSESASNWKASIKDLSIADTNNIYIWKVVRYKKNNTYTYGSPVYIGRIDRISTITYYEYTTYSSNSGLTNSTSGVTWSVIIPSASGNNKYIWQRKVTEGIGVSNKIYDSPTLCSGLTGLSDAATLAANIASGAQSVPKVSSTGISIDGNNINITATGKLTLAANSSLTMYSNAAGTSNAVIINKNGISIGTSQNIGIFGGGSITLGTVSDGTNTTVTTIDKNGIKITSAGKLEIDITKTDTSTTPATTLRRFCIDTSQLTNNNNTSAFIFYNGSSFDNADSGMRFRTSDGLTVKGNITATSGKIGGWTLSKTTDTIDGEQVTYTRLYSGTGTSRVCLSSAGDDYAIWAGAASAASGKFRVKRNGNVYINQLMVLDQVKNGKWEITGEAPGPNDGHEGKTGSGNSMKGYTPIDFSNLDFKNAVSLASGGSWSGGTFSATVSLWGKVNKSIGISAAVSVSNFTENSVTGSDSGIGTVTLSYSVNNVSTGEKTYNNVSFSAPKIWKNGYDSGHLDATPKSMSVSSRNTDQQYLFTIVSNDDTTKTLACDVTTIYYGGWNACVDWCNDHKNTYYTRNVANYGGSGNIHYIKNGDHYESIGTGWYQTQAITACTVPNTKP